MTPSTWTRAARIAIGASAMIACTGQAHTSSDDSGDPPDTDPPHEPDRAFTHKMMKPTGENMFAALAYECQECTFEHHLAIEAPEGWTKGPSQVILNSSGELRSTPSFDGVPDSMDFVPEVPGNEYILIAKNLDGTIIEAGSNGAIVLAQVMRDTLQRFSEGRRVHELTDPEGNIFVLIAYEVDPENVEIPDFQAADVLADFSGPDGWDYSTRVLDEELLLDSPEIATVLAIRTDTNSTWEMR